MILKKHLSPVFVILFLFLPIGSLLLLIADAQGNQNLQIKNVYTDQSFFNPARGEKTAIHFSLSKPAWVTITIYDSSNRAVMLLLNQEMLEAGNHQRIWAGLDVKGKPLPQNYYLYTIKAKDQEGKTVRYDPSDITGGKQIGIQNIKYDRNSDQVSFTLKEDAIVNMRAGMVNGGPMMNTLIDWMPYPAGTHVINWDGNDRSGNVNLKNVRKLDINCPAYALPMNGLIITGDQTLKKPLFLPDNAVLDHIRPVHRDPKQRRMMNHWHHPRNQCYDPDILIRLPAEQKYDKDGIALVDGPLLLTFQVHEVDRNFMMNQRFEVVNYVDFLFAHEEEMGFLPYYWTWDPRGINDGVHYITVMFRGYEGHFGTTTIKVLVRKRNNEQ